MTTLSPEGLKRVHKLQAKKWRYNKGINITLAVLSAGLWLPFWAFNALYVRSRNADLERKINETFELEGVRRG